MGKASTKENKCIYQLAREELHLTRADATTYIPDNADFPGMDGVTESRLVKIEHGDVTVQPEDVVAMAKRYNKPELRNYYCCNECAIGKIDAPEVTYTGGIHEILVNMAVSLKKLIMKKFVLWKFLKTARLIVMSLKIMKKSPRSLNIFQ